MVEFIGQFSLVMREHSLEGSCPDHAQYCHDFHTINRHIAMSSWHGGKGSKQRKVSNQKKFDDNWDAIFNKKNPVKKNMDEIHKPATHQDKKKEANKTECRQREAWWERP